MENAKHQISLKEGLRRHVLERHPRYVVTVNEQPWGELYFNMTGYVGNLPMVQGGVMNIGERPISAFRKEVSILNREAREALEAGANDPRKIVLTRPTSDNRFVMAYSRHPDEEERFHLLSRVQFTNAQKFFPVENVSDGSFVNSKSQIGLGFFTNADFSGNPQEDPVILLEAGDEWIRPRLGALQNRVMDAQEAKSHQRRIDRVIATDDEETFLVIGTHRSAGHDPEPSFVTRASLDFAQRIFRDEARVGDLELAQPAAIADPEVRAALAAEFPDLDLGGGMADAHPEEDMSGPGL